MVGPAPPYGFGNPVLGAGLIPTPRSLVPMLRRLFQSFLRLRLPSRPVGASCRRVSASRRILLVLHPDLRSQTCWRGGLGNKRGVQGVGLPRLSAIDTGELWSNPALASRPPSTGESEPYEGPDFKEAAVEAKSGGHYFFSTGALLVFVLSGSTIAYAQSDTSGPVATPTHGSMAQASSADKSFVKAALRGGMAEIELGQLAAEKGNSSDVKNFGQKMVRDHTKLGDQMKDVAGKVGVTPPTMLSPMDKALEVKLKALSGDDFDQAYIKAMVKDHQKDLADFKKEAGTGTSAEVKNAAGQGATVVGEHLDMIQKIAQAHHMQVSGGDQ